LKTVKEKNTHTFKLSATEECGKWLERQRIVMNKNTKQILAVSIAILIVALSLTLVFSKNLEGITGSGTGTTDLSRIACMGDSITNMTAYPADLQALLGSGFVVGDFGYTGAAVNFYSDRAYYFSDSYKDARAFQPNKVIIMLGTNDARANIVDAIGNFTINYEHMIQHMINGTRRFTSQPQIFVVIPPPIFQNNLNLTISIYTEQIIPRIRQVANDFGLPIIDVYTPLANHPEYFSDGVHPNLQGAQIIAKTIYQAIKS
jgi:acyl-CoA thioesterase I